MFSKTTLVSLLAVANALPNKRQAGGDGVESIDRSWRGNVPYGPTVRSCTTPGVIALTFDDGPTDFTNDLLNILGEYNAKATFFVTGLNGRPQSMDTCGSSTAAVVKRAFDAGHQIGHHTWNHPSLNGLDEQTFKSEIFKTEMAIRNIIGVAPTYLRPPYLECDVECERRLGGLGYHTVSVDLDTNDWRHIDNIGISMGAFSDVMYGRPSSALVLAHDTHATTVYSLTRHMLAVGAELGYRFVTVGECLGDPKEFWYRGAGSGGCSGNPSPPSTPNPSPPAGDGSCGANAGGLSCAGSASGPCCSQFGWCGTTDAHCTAGCQSAFGTCR